MVELTQETISRRNALKAPGGAIAASALPVRSQGAEPAAGAGRLATSYSPTFGVTTSYIYDAGGQRISKIFGAYETDYVHDPGGALLATYVNGSYFGNFQDLGVDGKHFGEVVMAAGNASQAQGFSLTDWLGSQAAYTDPATGVPTAAYLSQPFGDVQTTLFGSSNDDIHFTGKERDGDTGNDYFGARYYASGMGRFLTPDWSADAEPVPYASLDDPQSLNLYSYVENGPLSRTDPDGHWCLFDEALSIPASCTDGDSQRQLQEARDPAAKNAAQQANLPHPVTNVTVAGRNGGCDPSKDFACEVSYENFQEHVRYFGFYYRAAGEFLSGKGNYADWWSNVKTCVGGVGLPTLAQDVSGVPSEDASGAIDVVQKTAETGSQSFMYAAAVQSASRGLTVPLRSGVVRAGMAGAEKLGKFSEGAAVVGLYFGIYDAYKNEIENCL